MRLDELRAGLQSFLADAARSSYAVAANRVYYWPWPQGATLPLIAIARVTSGGVYHKFGTRGNPAEVDYQISAFAESAAEAEQVLALVLDDLDGHSGATGGVTIAMAKLLTINPEVYETDSGLHHMSADVRIAFDPS